MAAGAAGTFACQLYDADVGADGASCKEEALTCSSYRRFHAQQRLPRHWTLVRQQKKEMVLVREKTWPPPTFKVVSVLAKNVNILLSVKAADGTFLVFAVSCYSSHSTVSD